MCQASRPRYLTSIGVWLHTSPGEDTGCISCFVVAAAWRRRGVAAQLLDRALAVFRAAGLSFAEAYVKENAEGDAANCGGPLTLYLRAGFEIVGPVATTDPPLSPRLIVRRRL